MTERPYRHVYARNRLHAVWVILVETVKHPLTGTVIHLGKPE